VGKNAGEHLFGSAETARDGLDAADLGRGRRWRGYRRLSYG